MAEPLLFGPRPERSGGLSDSGSTGVGAAVGLEDVPVERVWLDETSWVDVRRGWLRGADEVFAAVRDGVSWRQGRLWRYERWVDEPRLGASWNLSRPPPHPVLVEVHRSLQWMYGQRFGGAGIARYRDGRDGQAFHRDRELRYLEDTLIGIVTLGVQRPFLLRPTGRRLDHSLPAQGATHDLAPAAGDLLVMGGRCQADWQHSVPKVHRAVGERISMQWRWTSRTGRPVEGPGYRAPRNFGDRARGR